MKKFLYLLVLACSSLTMVSGQDYAAKLEGLKKMKPTYINLFMKGDDPQLDLQRIKNIPGVGYASIAKSTRNDSTTFVIRESNTLLPIINFGSITDNFWYKLGLADINFRGRGITMSAHYQSNEGRHSGQFYYRNPFAIGDKWGYVVDIGQWASLEPLFFDEGRVNYEFQYRSAGLSIIRNFTIRERLELGGNYFVESYEKALEQDLQEPPGPSNLVQPKILSKAVFTSNHVNYDFFLLDGYDYRLTFQNVYNIDEGNFFNIAQLQVRKFVSQPRFGNLAMRFRLAFSTNNYSPFAPFVADSYVNLRGVGNRIDRGTGQAIFNIEYRKTVVKTYPVGVQFVVFSDIGTWRNPGGQLSELVQRSSIKQFVGAGFRIIYQQVFGATLRVDYGVDPFNVEQRGLVVGLGQYF